MPQLTVIVPVYNAEKYLCQCVSSILDQTFTDFELILADDGSTDESGAICDGYKHKDSRVRVIHQNNAGVSAARNAGLNIANGEYVTFVDSDDWIDPQMYAVMVETANQNDCDVILCDCIKEFGDHNELYTHDIRDGFYSCEELRHEYYPHLLIMENAEYPATIGNCQCVFRRRLLEGKRNINLCEWQKTIRYVEGVRYCEDLLFGAEMMTRARSFFYLKGKAFYHYNCTNQMSVSHQLAKDMWKDFIRLHEEAEEFFGDNMEYDFRHQLNLLLLSFLYTAMNNLLSSEVHISEKKEKASEILNNPKVRRMFSQIKVLLLPISWKLKVLTLFYKYRMGLNILLLRG